MYNEIRKFSPGISDKLGQYVYALRDPRDNKIFYIGEGKAERVFSHFYEADQAIQGNSSWSSKLRRIVEIWEAGLDVKWWIVRHNLQTAENTVVDVFDIEAALIDILEISQNGPALNDIAGHRNAVRGMLSEETVNALATRGVNPDIAFQTVFVFPIQKALAKNGDAYEATRRWWAVTSSFHSLPAIAVGLENGLSKGVFNILQWELDKATGKSQFNGLDITLSHPLANSNWTAVIGAAIGYWQYGNYLIVEFNGKGQFRFQRGSSNKDWQSL